MLDGLALAIAAMLRVTAGGTRCNCEAEMGRRGPIIQVGCWTLRLARIAMRVKGRSASSLFLALGACVVLADVPMAVTCHVSC